MLKYYFINRFDTNLISKQDRDTTIIYRNYQTYNLDNVLKIKKYCRKKNFIFLLSNNIKHAIKFNLDGAYIPSFNINIEHLSYAKKTNFLIVGSAHNLREIRIKEKQGCKIIMISSIFKKNKNYLGLNKFKLISNLTDKKIIALGGLDKNNLKYLNLTKCSGFAGISYFEQKKGP
tara:strand:+ start:577 stop:1101 length:525 start_codon:yes stop_codon:yes gene_type:complete